MEPRISVVIPTFDRADVLGRSLDSVLGQTLPPLEVVVVDDGSTDETERVVLERDPQLVRYVRLSGRSGAQAARNRGIEEAHGDWIAFQDSDDEWLPDKLERQVALLSERDFDPWTVVHGRAVVPGKEPMPARRVPEHALDDLLRAPAPFLQAMLVSRNALDEIGGLDENVPSFQEWDTAIRLASVCRFVEPEPAEPIFVYRPGTPNAISASERDDIRGYEYVIRKFRSEILERLGEETWSEHIRFLVRRALDFGLWEEGRRLLSLMRERDRRYFAYATCQRLHLRPRYLSRARGFARRRHTAAAA